MVVCPSFTVNCLETLEEIGIRTRSQWQQLGAETLKVIPSLNAHPQWVTAIAKIAKKSLYLFILKHICTYTLKKILIFIFFRLQVLQ